MTSKVIVSAHCANTKHVEVTRENPSGTCSELTVLQDGESREFYIWDDITVSVVEIDKDS